MIDRLVHHADILALKGDSYRLKDRDLARPLGTTKQNSRALPGERRDRLRRPSIHIQINNKQGGPFFDRRKRSTFRPALTACAVPRWRVCGLEWL
jgi:hypothetical protein